MSNGRFSIGMTRQLIVALLFAASCLPANADPMDKYKKCKDDCTTDRGELSRITVYGEEKQRERNDGGDRGHDGLRSGGKSAGDGEGKTFGQPSVKTEATASQKIAAYEKAHANFMELEGKLTKIINDIDRANEAGERRLTEIEKTIEEYNDRLDNISAEEIEWKKLQEAADKIQDGLKREIDALKDPKSVKILDKLKTGKDAWDAAQAEHDAEQALLDKEMLPMEIEWLEAEAESIKAKTKDRNELKNKAEAVLEATAAARKATEERLNEVRQAK